MGFIMRCFEMGCFHEAWSIPQIVQNVQDECPTLEIFPISTNIQTSSQLRQSVYYIPFTISVQIPYMCQRPGFLVKKYFQYQPIYNLAVSCTKVFIKYPLLSVTCGQISLGIRWTRLKFSVVLFQVCITVSGSWHRMTEGWGHQLIDLYVSVNIFTISAETSRSSCDCTIKALVHMYAHKVLHIQNMITHTL